MAIKGLTDNKDSDRSILGRVEISVFKGARKGERSAGKSLDDKYRIVCSNERIRKVLSSVYGSPDRNGDILTDELHVIFPFDEAERTFHTSMLAYSASGLEVVCDRHTISQEVKQITDGSGNLFRQMGKCSKPCPVADMPMGVKCDRGCMPTGVLYFYIRELLDIDLMVACKMTVHAYSDITYISSRLETLQSEIGSITNAPFPCFRTRHKVPFTLTRSPINIKRPVVDKDQGYKRTGKKTDGKAWAVEINPDPQFMQLHQAWKLAEEMKRLQVALPQKAIVGLLGGNPQAVGECIDVEVIPTPEPEVKEVKPDLQLMPPTINAAERKQFFQTFLNENNWTVDSVKAMLLHAHGITSTNEILVSQLNELLAIAKNHEVRDRWISQSEAF